MNREFTITKFISTIFATLFPVFLLIGGGHTVNTAFLLIIIVLLALSSSKVFFNKGLYSIDTNVITFLFVYFFLGVAPLVQNINGDLIWGGAMLTDQDYIYTSCVILMCLVIYNFCYSVCSRKIPPITNSPVVSTINNRLPILITIASTLFTLLIYSSSINLLFFREFEDYALNNEIIQNSSISLVYSMIIRPLPAMAFLYYITLCKDKSWIKLLFFASTTLITNFPLALPRFYVFGIYLPIMVAMFPGLLNKGILMKVLIFLGVLVVFPFLNQGRQITSYSELQIGFDFDMFSEGHFDNFQNFARVLKYNTITWGRQLIGVLFFAVPRSVFPNKPIGSGGYIADLYGLNFDHISMNYWAEGYLNFGFLGCILFSVILAYINSRMDIKIHGQHSSLFRNTYFIYLGLIFYILRGDLISGFAFTVGVLFSSYIIYKAYTYVSFR